MFSFILLKFRFTWCCCGEESTYCWKQLASKQFVMDRRKHWKDYLSTGTVYLPEQNVHFWLFFSLAYYPPGFSFIFVFIGRWISIHTKREKYFIWQWVISAFYIFIRIKLGFHLAVLTSDLTFKGPPNVFKSNSVSHREEFYQIFLSLILLTPNIRVAKMPDAKVCHQHGNCSILTSYSIDTLKKKNQPSEKSQNDCRHDIGIHW